MIWMISGEEDREVSLRGGYFGFDMGCFCFMMQIVPTL